MMEIISHRGYWKEPAEKNNIAAFERSFKLGFGTETDIRDRNGRLVISHDMPCEESVAADDFFTTYKQCDGHGTLALNIKADGLQAGISDLLKKYGIENYFVFDMSIPDTIGYMKAGVTFFSRQSEYEPQPAFYGECKGIWLDAFNGVWYNNELIHGHIKNGKIVAIVSAELHKRDHLPLWQQLKAGHLHQQKTIILCTDIPEDAANFFND